MTNQSPHMKLDVFADSHPGMRRTLNQDTVLATNGRGIIRLLIVADGMGGHQAGEIASQLTVSAIYKSFEDLIEPKPGDTPPISTGALEAQLKEAVQQANHAIYQYADSHPDSASNLGSTVTCAVLYGGFALIANVGDSRTYLLRENNLQQITDDHSYVADLVRKGMLDPQEIYTHPLRSIITRALGMEPYIEVDTFCRDLYPGDQLLLCSDGLWEMVQANDEIVEVLSDAPTPAEAVEKLIDAANRHGGGDNIGVVVGKLIAA